MNDYSQAMEQPKTCPYRYQKFDNNAAIEVSDYGFEFLFSGDCSCLTFLSNLDFHEEAKNCEFSLKKLRKMLDKNYV